MILSVADAKAHLRVDGADDDALITSLIEAAIDHVEGFTGLTLEPREIEEAAAGFGGRLGTWPVREITSVSYRDGSGAEQQLADGAWWANLASRPLRLNPVGSGWPALGGGSAPVTVTMQAGYEEGEVPAGIVQALKMIVRHFYDDQDGKTDMPGAIAALLRPHRLERV